MFFFILSFDLVAYNHVDVLENTDQFLALKLQGILLEFAKVFIILPLFLLLQGFTYLFAGYGFIRFSSMDSAMRAIAGEHGQRVGNKTLSVSLARQKGAPVAM